MGVVELVLLVELVLELEEPEPLSLEPQAVSALRAITAAIPAVTGKRRGIRLSVMASTQLSVRGLHRNLFLARGSYPLTPDVKRIGVRAGQRSRYR